MDKQQYTSMDNLESLINLIYMLFDGGMRSEYLKKTHIDVTVCLV